jgi:hypothetical protein
MTGGWKDHANAEIERAMTARQAGNEGMARVCARRATGHIIGEYFSRLGIFASGPSAYNRLQALIALPQASKRVKAIAMNFLVRITPEHTLPVDVDLVAEASRLAKELLGEDL